jgi:CheY-like chemotaxis protein
MLPADRTLRILLVEDHVATASALAKTLLRQGFAVAPANSARAALEAARLQPFDLLITDIGLPHKNGWELFRELRRLQPQLVAIAVTGYAYPQDVQRSIEVGIHVHLVKPATVQQVLGAIWQVFPAHAPQPAQSRLQQAELPLNSSTSEVRRGKLTLLYLEDDARDVELLQLTCAENEPDCELVPAMSRTEFVAALQTGRFDGILSDSGVHDLLGADAVRLARSLAPTLPYIFLCGMMDPAKRADLVAANPDGFFSKDQPGDVERAIALARSSQAKRLSPQ